MLSFFGPRVVFFLLAFNLQLYGKVVVIADIDDTIKQSHTQNLMASFFQLFKNRAYPHMAAIFRDLRQNLGVEGFYYVSSSYAIFYDAQKFVAKYLFPEGKYFQRLLFKSSVNEYKYKYKAIAQIIEDIGPKEAEFIFFGDNSSLDVELYQSLKRNYQLNAKIYIRDVALNVIPLTEHLEYGPSPKEVNFFISEGELIKGQLKEILSPETIDAVLEGIEQQNLLPKYLTKNQLHRKLQNALGKANKRARKNGQCLDSLTGQVRQIWQNYYSSL